MHRPALLLALSVPALAQYSVQDLSFSSSNPGGARGHAVDTYGTLGIVGADYDAGAPAQEVFLFHLLSGTEQQRLSPPPAFGPDSGFGLDVALTNDLAVVGAPREFGGEGTVAIYHSGSGVLENLLFPTPSGVPASFGTRVSAGGNYVTVAAPQSGATADGTLEVFEIVSPTTQNHLYTLEHPNPGPGIKFGPEHDTNGVFLAVKSHGPFGDDAVYVFDVATGALVSSLFAFPATTHQDFGADIAVTSDRVLVGAPNATNGATQSGATFIFDLLSGQQLRKLRPSNDSSGDRFGAAVTAWGSEYLCGAPGAHRVYAFDRDTGVEAALLERADDPEFGSALSISSGAVLVGAPGASGGDGDAWLYTSEACSVLVTCPQPPNSTGLEGDATVISCSLSQGTRIFFSQLPGGQFGYPLVGAGPVPINPPGANGTVCLGGSPIGRYIDDIQLVNTVGTVVFDPVSGPTGGGRASLPDPPGGEILPGDTWGYQFWYRDVGNTSSFTRQVRVTFKL